ncbi:MAG: uroporphyrinogen-III C-methyltransferase, partial [Pseudomonadota bacterium]|nr:uroporphyrinogen-III C-methyltransferase [Pseudomonadota bacterium]
TELSEKKQADFLKAEMESLTDSFNLRFEKLKNKSSEPQIAATTLVTMENYLIRANRYLTEEKDPRNASRALKSAESLVVQLAPDLRLILSEIFLREISRLEQLAEMPIYSLPRMLNRLVSLIGNMVIETRIQTGPESNQERQSLEIASSKGVIESLWIELRSLVTVNEVDHELVNQFSVDDARLVRLNLQLEAAVARAAFLAGNLDLLEASLNNLKNLCQTYLSEKSSVVELLMKISELDLDILSEEERHLRDLIEQVRDLRLSQGFGG